MTREEAIKKLVNARYADEFQGDEELTTAHLMAIQALSQEPCDDAISREDAYKIVMMPDTPFGKHKGVLIRELPPVTVRQTECLKAQAKKQAMPMSCDDCCYEPNSPFCEMYRKDICEKKDERQSGEWIDYSYEEGYVECPFCGHATNCEDNIDELHYCFYCGARMESEDKTE